MAQRDYILRQIEQAAAALARILDRVLGREAPTPQVRAELDALGRSLGADLELARGLAPETLLMLISAGGEPEPGRCWVFAESLYIDGLDAHLDGRDAEAAQLLARARLLYEALERSTFRLAGVPDIGQRLDTIDRLLAVEPPAAG